MKEITTKDRLKTVIGNAGHRLRCGMYAAGLKIFPARKRNKAYYLKSKTKMALFAWAVMSVQVVLFAVFYVYVNLNSILLGFQDSVTGEFTVANFRLVLDALFNDGTIWIAFKNTVLYFIISLILIPFNVIISVVLYKKILGYKVFQVIFFLPSIIGAMVWMAAYKAFIAPYGPLVELLSKMHLINGPAPQFLADSRFATFACAASSIWLGLPSGMLRRHVP